MTRLESNGRCRSYLLSLSEVHDACEFDTTSKVELLRTWQLGELEVRFGCGCSFWKQLSKEQPHGADCVVKNMVIVATLKTKRGA